MQLIKTIIVFTFLFVLFYFEPVPVIGTITFSQLWKIPFILFLVWQVLIITRIKSKPGFVRWSYARGIKNLFNGGMLTDAIPQILDFIRYMMFPLMYEFFSMKIKSLNTYNRLLIGFSQFIIISGIPFVLGFLESKGRQLTFGEDFNSYVGLFQNPHASAVSTAIAILVILAQLRSKQLKYRWFNYVLVLLGMYLLFLSFVRTGYLMFIVGLIVLYKPSKLSIRQIAISMIVLSILVIGISYLLQTNDLFYNRVFDIRNNQQSELGSGRLLFWRATVDLWLSGGYFELLFGHGSEALTQQMYDVTGLRVFSHSEVFTQLGQNGLIGLVIFIGSIVSMFRFVWKKRACPSFKLSITMLTIYLSAMIIQGGVIFPFDVFMALIFAKLTLENKLTRINSAKQSSDYLRETKELSNA